MKSVEIISSIDQYILRIMHPYYTVGKLHSRRKKSAWFDTIVFDRSSFIDFITSFFSAHKLIVSEIFFEYIFRNGNEVGLYIFF